MTDGNITHNQNGSITVSAMYKGYREHQTYIGYTEQEAKEQFRLYLSQIDRKAEQEFTACFA